MWGGRETLEIVIHGAACCLMEARLKWVVSARRCPATSFLACARTSQHPMGFSALLVGMYHLAGALWLFQLHVMAWVWGALLRWMEDRESWLGSRLYFHWEKNVSPICGDCFSSLKHCFGEPSVRTAWYKKEIQTLFSLYMWNCITGQMATTCVDVKYVQYNAGSTGTTAESFCETGDFVLFSYQVVSEACSLLRSAVFVWSRPEW